MRTSWSNGIFLSRIFGVFKPSFFCFVLLLNQNVSYFCHCQRLQIITKIVCSCLVVVTKELKFNTNKSVSFIFRSLCKWRLSCHTRKYDITKWQISYFFVVIVPTIRWILDISIQFISFSRRHSFANQTKMLSVLLCLLLC